MTARSNRPAAVTVLCCAVTAVGVMLISRSSVSTFGRNTVKQRRRQMLLVSPAGLLVAVAIVLMWFALFLPAPLHYRMLHDEAAFNAVLHRYVKANDSIQHVQTLLGKGRHAPEWVTSLRRATEIHPQGFPDSVQEGDTILEYPLTYAAGSGAHYLQFRNGKIINFDPKSFAQSHQVNILK